MCGICGYTRSNVFQASVFIEKMSRNLAHRGPDGNGVYEDDAVVMAHRRLSIIDVAGGMQPISNEDKTLFVVCNGEIYNYLELRQNLETKGHRFRTASDTEVLIHLYEEHHENMLNLLVGMFAFAIWNVVEKSLLLVRDRYGQKPLYYAERNGELIFASELKSLVKHPWIECRINPEALCAYFSYDYVPSPLSIYSGVYKLDAGSFLRWRDGKTRIKRYWDYPVGLEKFKGSFRACCHGLEEALQKAVRGQLVSDVPLGVFLSGGVDSTSILALMSRDVPPSGINTFSIGFNEKSYDESKEARYVARFFGTTHHEDILDIDGARELVFAISDIFDEPFADPSALPTYLLSRHTAKHVKVALGGDGGDELFAGYDPFVAYKFAKFVQWIPEAMRVRILEGLMDKLPISESNMSFEFRLKRFLGHIHKNPVVQNHRWIGSFTGSTMKKLLRPELLKKLRSPDGIDPVSGIPIGKISDIEAITYYYIRNYMQEGILTKVDRASMACGLEVRAPFLDHHLGEFVAAIPDKWKLNGLRKKYILKKTMADIVPARVLKRPKKGFGIPRAKWLRGSFRELLQDLFTEKAVAAAGVFNYPYIRRVMHAHFNRERDYQKELWSVLMFELWRKNNMGA